MLERYAAIGQGSINRRKSIAFEVLASETLLLPPLPEQKKIAAILLSVDEAIQATQRVIDQTRRVKEGLLQDLLTRGLPGHKRFKPTEIGEIPESWEVRRLDGISPSLSVGLVLNPSTYFAEDGTVPMLVGSNIKENGIDWKGVRRISTASNETLRSTQIYEGDLVTVRVGNPGLTLVVPPELDGSNCASVMIVRRHESFDSDWLCAALNSQQGAKQFTAVQYGTAQRTPPRPPHRKSSGLPMTTANEYTLVEKPILDRLQAHGYRYIHPNEHPVLRPRENEVLFKPLLVAALVRINGIPKDTAEAIFNDLAGLSDNQRWLEVLRGHYSRKVPGRRPTAPSGSSTSTTPPTTTSPARASFGFRVKSSASPTSSCTSTASRWWSSRPRAR
jgi:hypothetical protein